MSRKNKSRNKAPQAAPPELVDKRIPHWVIGLIVLATLLAYSNSFGGSFIYDDDQAIIKNYSIRSFWPPWGPFFPPFDLTVGGRPLLNLSFAINYAISGMSPWSYHVFNFTIHILVGLTLLGVLRRTFLQPPMHERFGADAVPLAIAVTLLWILNPLQTESVSYISQRAEALMALFYLLTIYCFIRATEPQTVDARRWTILAVVCCCAGAAFKEIMVTAPIMVLLYDRTFVAGTFRQALRRRGRLYAGLALSWLVIAYGVSDIRGRIVGYSYGVTAWDYALTECPALLHYIHLMVWPHPLIIDYGIHMYTDLDQVLLRAIAVVALLVLTAVALVRWPLIGFAGAWFFLILAPTSSFYPIVVSPIGEHRLYLPLLTYLVPLVLALRYFLGPRFGFPVIAFWIPVIALAAVWGVLTFLRNEDYSTDVNLWRVTVAQKPNNARAHNNYGVTLLGANPSQPAAAAEQFQLATTIQPSYPDAHYNWGNAVAQLGRFEEAIGHYQVALQQKPSLGSAHNNWGNALDAMGREPEAIEQYQLALQINPNDPQFHYNLGHGYLVLNKLPEALEQFRESLQLNPNMADTHNTLGIVYFQMGQKQKAIEEFQEALRLNPNLKAAQDNLIKVGGPAP